MTLRSRHARWLRAALILAVAVPASAWAVAPLPAEFETVDIKNLLGTKPDLNVGLIDHTGRTVNLADFFDGERPVVLTLNYYRCESLCSVQLNELLKSLKHLPWVAGDGFRQVTISFDPRDDAEVAAGKRTTYLRQLARARAEQDDEELDEVALAARAETVDWAFLTGRPKTIRAITERLGYSYYFDSDSGQYAHAPVVYFFSPDGTIARYLFGITYRAQDLKFAIMEASKGRLGSFGDKLLLSCFAFDEDSGGYAAFAWGFMRIGGMLVLLVFGSWLLLHWRRERRNRLTAEAPSRLTPAPSSETPS